MRTLRETVRDVMEGGPGSGRHSGGGTTTQDIAQLSLQRMNKKTGMIRIVTPEVVRLRHWRKKYVGYAKGLKSMGRSPSGFKSYVKANRPQSEGRKAVESLKEIIHNVVEYGVQGMKWGQRKETDVVVGKPIKVFGRHATAIGAPTRSGLQARYNTMKGRMKQIKSWKQHHVTPTYAAIRATYQRGTQFHRTAKTIGQQMKNIKIWMRHAKD